MAQKKRPGSTNRVRIIGGQWRGRLIRFPNVQGLRPSSDRVRETLFNWLQFDLHGQRVLDLFAGSGALGFEAASRGAAEVVMIEQSPRVAAQLEKSANELQADQVRIIRGDGPGYLAGNHEEAFDVVFLDPPFNKDLLAPALTILHDRQLLTSGALIYIEMPVHETVPELPEGWSLQRVKEAGDVRYGLINCP
jgi:16S rRNA (guanine966-N2)-methyltransferase